MFRIYSEYENAKSQDIERNVEQQRQGLTDWDLENLLWAPEKPTLAVKARKLALAFASLITNLILR